jgi:large subunit ribosomal protein L24
LLGLAIAIILALVTALAGPLLIEWKNHRVFFETEAGRLIGLDVRVNGDIEVRLLPSPRLTLRDIVIGGAKGVTGEETVGAKSLGIELALGSLMRGEWRATELRLSGAKIRLGLDGSGHIQAPKFAVEFKPDALTIDRLTVEDGEAVLTDAAAGTTFTLTQLSFNGDVRSLLGPVKGDGAATLDGTRYPFRIAAGRYGDDDTLRFHVSIDGIKRLLSAEADGILTLTDAAPRFEGTWSLRRPAGVNTAATSIGSPTLIQPWFLNGKIKATAQSALMQQVEFQYGSDDRALKLTGVGEFMFGKQMRFDGVISGRQVDLDRALSRNDATQFLPADAVRAIGDLSETVSRPPFPVQIGFGIDQLTLGGGTIQNFRGDLRAAVGGWDLDRVEFRAPGFTQVQIDGHLGSETGAAGFNGAIKIGSTDPNLLAGWLQGREEANSANLRPLSLRGDVSIEKTRIALDRVTMEFDGKPIVGHIVYDIAANGLAAKLDIGLNAAELNVDALAAYGNAMVAGSSLERPGDLSLTVDAERAVVAGFKARDVSARIKAGAEGLQIERLAVADLGGAAFSATGRIVIAPPAPSGRIDVKLTTPDMSPVLAVLGHFAPEAARSLASTVMPLAPADLHAQLTIDGVAASTLAKFSLDGSVSSGRVALNGDLGFDPLTLRANNIRLEGKLQSDDDNNLISALGLAGVFGIDGGPSTLSLAAQGPIAGELRLDSRFSARGIDANASGSAQLFGNLPSANLRIALSRANAGPSAGASFSGKFPIGITGQMNISGDTFRIDDIAGTIGGAAVRGKLDGALSQPRRFNGEIEADTIDGAGLVAAAAGFPAPLAIDNGVWLWPAAPFRGGAFGEWAIVMPWLQARNLTATVQFGKQEWQVDIVSGEVAGGKLNGELSVRANDDARQAHGKLVLTKVAAANLFSQEGKTPVAGVLDATIAIDGAGNSPRTLIGSLHGTGNIGLADARLAGLDPRAFDYVVRAVDQGLPNNAARVGDVMEKGIDSGTLQVRRGDAEIAIGGGQIRLVKSAIDSGDARLAVSGLFNLMEGAIDARAILSGAVIAAGARPDIFMTLKGPIAAPKRSIDVSALNAWLTLRAVEIETARLRAIESARPRIDEQNPKPQRESAPELPAPMDIRRLPARSIGSQN